MISEFNFHNERIGEVYVADTFLKRFLGYMFRQEPHYEAILIKPCSSIHTFFMKFDLDVLFLNKDMEIIKKIENLRPNRAIMPVKECTTVIEAKAGTLRAFAVGDKIAVEAGDSSC